MASTEKITSDKTKKFDTKYESEIVAGLTGATLKSFIEEFILSSTITIFAQNATVTELTLKTEDNNHAPAIPLSILLSMVKSGGKAALKLSK